jgi:hypothetical protein
MVSVIRRQIPILALVALFSAFLTAPVSAYYGDSADVVEKKRMRIGLSGCVATRPGILGLFSGGVGVTDWASVHLNAGFGTTDRAANAAWVGADFKALISEFFGGTDNVAVFAGPVWNRDFGGRSGVMLTTKWKFLQFNTGLDTLFWFSGPATERFNLQFLIGAKIREKIDFLKMQRLTPSAVIEVAVPMTPGTGYAFTLGLHYDLDYKVAR